MAPEPNEDGLASGEEFDIDDVSSGTDDSSSNGGDSGTDDVSVPRPAPRPLRRHDEEDAIRADKDLFGSLPNIKKLQEAVTRLSLKSVELSDELDDERFQTAELQRQLRKEKRKKPQVSTSTTTKKRSKLATSYTLPAQRMLILYSGWVDEAIFLATRPDPPPDVWSVARYRTTETDQQANVEELYLSVDPQLQYAISHTAVVSKFRKALQQYRANGILHVKSRLHAVFADMELIDANLWSLVVNKKTDSPEVQALWQDASTLVSSKPACLDFPHILFQKYREPENKSTMGLFHCEAIPKIIKIYLFGQTALDIGSVPKANTIGMKMKLKSVTIGTIAFAAVALVFLISGDTSFTSGPGGLTGIKYPELFGKYKELLVQKSAASAFGAQWVKNLLARVNQIVFNNGAITTFDSQSKVPTRTNFAAFLQEEDGNEPGTVESPSSSRLPAQLPIIPQESQVDRLPVVDTDLQPSAHNSAVSAVASVPDMNPQSLEDPMQSLSIREQSASGGSDILEYASLSTVERTAEVSEDEPTAPAPALKKGKKSAHAHSVAIEKKPRAPAKTKPQVGGATRRSNRRADKAT